MQVLSIFGSPNKQGNSSTLHNEFLKPLKERGLIINKIQAYEVSVYPCTDCGLCTDRPECMYKDDMTEIYSLIEESSLITISSPLYFSSFPSPLKAIIDRCQLIWEERRRDNLQIKERRGFFICTGGSEYGNMFSGAVTGIKHFFNSVGVSFSEENSILYSGTDSMDEISLEFLAKARYSGETFIR